MKHNKLLLTIALCINLSSTISLAQQAPGWGSYATSAFDTIRHQGSKVFNMGTDLFKGASTHVFNTMSSWSPKLIIAVVVVGLGILTWRYGKKMAYNFALGIMNPREFMKNQLNEGNYSPILIEQLFTMYELSSPNPRANIAHLQSLIASHYASDLMQKAKDKQYKDVQSISNFLSDQKSNPPLKPSNETVTNKTKKFINDCYLFAINALQERLKEQQPTETQQLLLKNL